VILTKAVLGPFRSMNRTQTLAVDPNITVLVGMNEAGKTVLLKALHKSEDALGQDVFEPIEDYPRKDLSSYLKVHATEPADVAQLTYALNSTEVAKLNMAVGTTIKDGLTFTVTHKYDNKITVSLSVDEAPSVKELMKSFSSDAAAAIKDAKRIRDVPALLTGVSLTPEDTAALAKVNARIAAATWDNVTQFETWTALHDSLPFHGPLRSIAPSASRGRSTSSRHHRH
jgi:hypothetical protein